jgi:hypothetical protein
VADLCLRAAETAFDQLRDAATAPLKAAPPAEEKKPAAAAGAKKRMGLPTPCDPPSN